MFAAGLALIGSLQMVGSVAISSSICQVPTVPTIVLSTGDEVVRTDTIQVYGTAMADTTVTLTGNSTTLAAVTADQDNQYSAEITLADGEYEIGVTSKNPCGQNSGTPVSVRVDTPDAPVTNDTNLIEPQGSQEIASGSQEALAPAPNSPATQPADATKKPGTSNSNRLSFTEFSIDNYYETAQSSIFLTGSMNQKAKIKVYVNGKQSATLLQPSFSFGVQIPLTEGKNTVEVTAYTKDQQVAKSVVIMRGTHFSKDASENTPWYATPVVKAVAVVGATVAVGGVVGTSLGFIRRRGLL